MTDPDIVSYEIWFGEQAVTVSAKVSSGEDGSSELSTVITCYPNEMDEMLDTIWEQIAGRYGIQKREAVGDERKGAVMSADYGDTQGVCAKCGNMDIEYTKVEFDGEMAHHPYVCCECETQGYESYTVEFFENVVEWSPREFIVVEGGKQS